MSDHPTISIIGPGTVGTALGILAARAGLTVVAVGGRDEDKTQRAAARIGLEVRPLSIHDAAASAELVLLTVSDDAIEAVCNELAEAGAFQPNAIVAHCSGALGSDALAAAKAAGCRVGSMHPLQTFPTPEAVLERLAGAFCFCEGDREAVNVLTTVASAVGANPAELSSDGKALYHAAAVTAGNYVTTLLDAAVAMCEQAGINPQIAQQAMAVLAATTAMNACDMDLTQSLTGPVARGDVGTIERHLQAIESCDEDVRKLYCVAALRTVDLALRKGSIDEPTAQALRDVLSEER
jgi:predicted short-subunit dehydrogenase-like oxidoreductase (DUF2520 family)